MKIIKIILIICIFFLSKSYADIDLEFEDWKSKFKKGEIIGLIGETGSGKSTFVDIILGLLDPKKGNVLVDKTNIKTNLLGWQKNLGYVPQSIFLSDDSLKNNVAFGLNDDPLKNDKVEKTSKDEKGDLGPRGPKGESGGTSKNFVFDMVEQVTS